MKKTNATNRTPVTKSTDHDVPSAAIVMFLGLALTLLSAIGILVIVISDGFGNTHGLILGDFAWAIIPAGALLCTIAFDVPVLRFLRRHPVFLYLTLSAVSIVSMAYYSISAFCILELYLGIYTYLSATMLAAGAYLLYVTPVEETSPSGSTF